MSSAAYSTPEEKQEDTEINIFVRSVQNFNSP